MSVSGMAAIVQEDWFVAIPKAAGSVNALQDSHPVGRKSVLDASMWMSARNGMRAFLLAVGEVAHYMQSVETR